MWTRRQFRQIDVLIIPTAVALLIPLGLADLPDTLLAEIAVAVPWFALVAATVTLITSQTFLSDDDSRLSAGVQGANLVVSILLAGLTNMYVVTPLFFP